MRATSSVGQGKASSSSVLVPDVPGAPTSVHATASGLGQVTVSHSPPSSDGGAPITRYGATCSASGQPDGTGSVTAAPFGPITISGLTPGVTYTCSVVATNWVGASPASSGSNVLVPFPPQKQPTEVHATVTADREVTVTYAAIPDSANGGAPVTRYQATCSASGQPNAVADAAPSQPVVLDGLARGDTYSCTVAADNVAGAGPNSTAVSVFVPLPPQAAPTNVVAAPSGPGSVLVNYSTVPDASNGGAPITKYRAVCRASGQPDRTGEVNGPSFGPITVTGLTPTVLYSCTVEAVNIAGSGLESSPATVVAP